MAQNQDFSTVTHEESREELEVSENEGSNATINLEEKVELDEFIINHAAEHLVNSKTTVQDKQTRLITSSEINITNEILPDQPLETTVSKETKDFIGNNISVHMVEVEKILGDGKDLTTKETAFSKTTITPIDDVHLTQFDENDDELIDRQYDFMRTEEKKSHDSEEYIDNPRDSVKNEENVSLGDGDIYNSHENIPHDSTKNEEKASLYKDIDILHDSVKTEGNVSLDDEEDVYNLHDNIPHTSIKNGENVSLDENIDIPHDLIKIEEKVSLDYEVEIYSPHNNISHDSIKNVENVSLDEDADSPHDNTSHDFIKNEEKESLDEDIDNQHDSVKTKEKVSLEGESDDSPYYSAKIDEKVSLDNDDVESLAPSTPQGEENILATISKVAPELKQVLDTWNGELSRYKNSEDRSDTLGKDTDSDKLLQGEITYVKEDVIEEEKKHDVRDEEDNFVSDIQSLSSKRIKDILDKDLDSDKFLQGETVYVKENVIEEEERRNMKDKDDFMSDIQSSPYKRIKNVMGKNSDLDKLSQDEITYVKKDIIEEDKHNVKYGENFISSDIQGSPSKRIKIEVNLNEKQDDNVSNVQTLLQPTSSTPSSVLLDVVESMFVPGFNRNVVLAIDLVFLMLLMIEGVLAVMTDYNVYVLVHMGITLALFIALQLFLAEAYRAQVEEVGLIAKKEE
ncbi:1440_t:CDS:2 [Cetraspora pellucida]|uniref:1440_t:CDS:1 n=1 Tax=Cetraspora pellucida TaxID=1433469 RepID=A0ACA9M1T8_9GLOM|nr:1440_t:CDS:2 [Cetraspora pellucida]